MSTFPVRDIPPESVAALAARANVHPITARCLLARGVGTEPEVADFFAPKLSRLRPPVGLADLDVAVKRIAHAINSGETIGVFGDYDVDGVTTTALITEVTEAMGGRAVPRVARRAAGYGFGVTDAEFFAAKHCQLIITGDCGTSDIDAIGRANELNIDVIVIDHHTVPDGNGKHPAFALINPFREDSTFEFTGFASVGLAFYVMQTVRSALRRAGAFANRVEPDLRNWLDLVAVGTIADLVPLHGENRILTSLGLRVLARRSRPGLAALWHLVGLEPDAEIGAREVSWKLSPRLNAPGRLGDARPALDLLLAKNRERGAECAARLEEANDERRAAQDEAYAEALGMVETAPPGACAVVAGRGWKPGVVGIVAARLVDLLKRPVFAIAIEADGVARGSARTFGHVSVYDALASASPLLSRFGGHAAAAGLSIDPANIDELRGHLETAVSEQLSNRPPPVEQADADVEISELSLEVATELERLRPFGKGNAELRMVARNLEVLESRSVGADHSHLKLVLASSNSSKAGEPQNVEIGAIGFGLAAEAPRRGEFVDVLFSPLLNRWRGSVKVEMQIHAIEPSVQPAQQSSGFETESSTSAEFGSRGA